MFVQQKTQELGERHLLNCVSPWEVYERSINGSWYKMGMEAGCGQHAMVQGLYFDGDSGTVLNRPYERILDLVVGCG